MDKRALFLSGKESALKIKLSNINLNINLFSIKKQHLNLCSYEIVECLNLDCDFISTRGEMDKHKLICTQVIIIIQ